MADAPPFDPNKPFEPVGQQTGAQAGAAPAFDPSKPYEEVGPSYWDYAKDVGKQVLTAPVRIAEGAMSWPAQVLNLAGEGLESLGVATPSPEQKANREALKQLGRERGVGQYLPKAETLPGKYAGTIADFAGAALTSPGRLAVTVPAAVTGAVTSETAGQLAETAGPIAEGAARIVGAIAGTGGVLGGVGLARHFTGQGAAEIAQKRLVSAFTRDGDTPDTALQRLAQVRETRPDATLIDVAGPEVRGVLEMITQSPGPAKAVTTPFLQAKQRGQMDRLVGDLTQATGSQRTAFRAIEDTMAARREAATPLYQQAYADGDRAVWSNELERLSAAPFVQGAMRKAVSTWRNQAIADGYGAMNPGANVDRGGILTLTNQQLPAFPNIQFWDYTKRMLDDMTSTAIRAGQNQKARTLTVLTQQLRADLDQQVPSYARARDAWSGPSRYMEAIEDGRSILSKNMTAEELAATFQGLGAAEQEAYRIGVVSTIRNTMASNAAKLPDLTRVIRSPEMRAKLEVIMPSPAAAQRFNRALDYEIQSAETANQALTGSATARRLAAMEDANNLVDELAMAALPHKLGGTGLWSLIAGVPKKAQGMLRRQSDEEIARTLTSPYPASALGQPAPQSYVPGAAIGTGLGLASTPLQGDQNAQRVSRQAGGGIPAIGGTGGRSPGARETARTRSTRPRTGQALPDGGAEGDEQAHEIVLSFADGGEVSQPPAPRERFAAALQGTPTGAGFGGDGGQQRKPKPPSSLSREEIRRTLQSFGITGEEAGGFAGRQLGEVDSRADGGAVKRTKGSVNYSKGMKDRCGLCQHYSDHKCAKVQGYIGPGMWCELFKKQVASRAIGGGIDDEPGGERAPIHYDPGDETTFDARFGKWDKTATGKSLPRDEEEVDATVMAPGQKMIDPLGHRGERGAAGYYMLRGMAEGGEVEDRYAALPSSSNVEDRREEEPLSAGQMIAGNQAFMGKYPAPYTRGSRSPALPSALVEQTKSYLADQIGGVERKHEHEDPHDGLIADQGGYSHPQGEGGSDEGHDPFAASAARTRRRAPVREPDPVSLAASQGKGASWKNYLPSEERARAASMAMARGEPADARDTFLSSLGIVGSPIAAPVRGAGTVLGAGAVRTAKPAAKAISEAPLAPEVPMLLGNPELRGSMSTLENLPFTYRGKGPAEWTPEEFAEVGQHFGVPRLGPASPPKAFKYADGESFSIPGGLKGEFTYYDLLQMKAQGIDPSRIPRELHTELQQKLMRSMDVAQPVSPERTWSGLMFGMTSPNNPLFPNQLTQSILRIREPGLRQQLAEAIPWQVGDKVSQEARLAASDNIAAMLGINAGSKGGLGVRGSMDYTRIAELAQMWEKNPTWFSKTDAESWPNYVERLSSQVTGLSMKTGSFGGVWQDPAHAGVSAIDRHMVNEFERTGKLFQNRTEQKAFEQRAVERWNNANEDDPVTRYAQLKQKGEGFLTKMKLEYVGNEQQVKLRTRKGDISPSVPSHLTNVDWPSEPSHVKVMGEAYRRALDWNQKLATQHGLNLFPSQWLEWDRIRRRFEPHENMFPGLERMPAMSREQLRKVSEEHTASGHKTYGKTEGEEGQMNLQPTRPRSNPAGFAYFQMPPVGGMPGLMRRVLGGEDQEE
jgi:hypothetical protein